MYKFVAQTDKKLLVERIILMISKLLHITFYENEFHIHFLWIKSYFKQKSDWLSRAVPQHYWVKILILLLIFPLNIEAQDYADKSYYLIDSLKLEELSENDRSLLDSALTLYHEAVNDTVRCNAIYLITQGMAHEVWSRYNEFLYSRL